MSPDSVLMHFSLLQASQTPEQRVAALERELAENHVAHELLQKEVEVLRRENGATATDLAVKLAVAAREAEVVRLQRQLEDLECSAQVLVRQCRGICLQWRNQDQTRQVRTVTGGAHPTSQYG